MAEIVRVRVEWNGLAGLPGISTFYVGTTDADISELVTFYNAIKALFPSGLSWTIPANGDVIEATTGELTGTHIFTGAGTVSGTGGSAAYAAGVGLRVRWLTGAVVNGRRVVGTTFLTHWLSSNYDQQGSIDDTDRATVQTAASAFVAAGSPWGIWHRPTTLGGSDGSFHAMNGALVPDRVSWLRTRKV